MYLKILMFPASFFSFKAQNNIKRSINFSFKDYPKSVKSVIYKLKLMFTKQKCYYSLL